MINAAIKCFLLVVAFNVPANADVRLAIDEASVLPGTPTGFTIIITNPGKKAIQVPPALWLIATNEDFQTFRVSAYNSSDTAAMIIPDEQRTIAAGGQREFRYDPSTVLAGSPWFSDGRLSKPGKYRLRAVVAPEVQPNGQFNAAGAFASDEQPLTVAVESDDDAAVWKWMDERGLWEKDPWTSVPPEFAEFVMKEHPESGYALFAAIFIRHRQQKMPLLAEQAERFARKSFADQAKLLLAQFHSLTVAELSQSDMKRAADASDTARHIASELERNSRSSNVRAQARDLLRQTPTREQLMRQPKAR